MSTEESEDISERSEVVGAGGNWLPRALPISTNFAWVVLWILAARELAILIAGAVTWNREYSGSNDSTIQAVGLLFVRFGSFGDGLGVVFVVGAFVLSWVSYVLRGTDETRVADPLVIIRVRAQLLFCAVLAISVSIGAVLITVGTALFYRNLWTIVLSNEVLSAFNAVFAGIVTYIVLRLRRSIEPVSFES